MLHRRERKGREQFAQSLSFVLLGFALLIGAAAVFAWSGPASAEASPGQDPAGESNVEQSSEGASPDHHAAEKMAELLDNARATDRDVMVVFGAQWCDRCVLLDKYIREGDLGDRIAEDFVVLNIDVGDWSQERRQETQYGHPTREGLPAVVLVDAEEDLVDVMASKELTTFLPDRDQPIYNWMEDILYFADQAVAIQ